MAEARCPHKFLRSAVPCPTCDGAMAKPARLRQSALPIAVGDALAGVKVHQVLTVEQRPHARVVCRCGKKFSVRLDNLRRTHREGRTTQCGSCVQSEEQRPAAPVASEIIADGVLRWWRLELDADGGIKNCTPAEGRGGEGEPQIVYVLAHDQKAAGKLAWNEYTKHRERMKRARMIAEGKCPWCCKAQDRSPGKRCTVCLKRESKRERNERKLARGEDVPPSTHAASRLERLKDERAALRIEILGEVRKFYDGLSARKFSQWLNEQLGVGVRDVG